MVTRDQLKQFVTSMLDLHRDNFIDLLHNPEFQFADLEEKERAVQHVTTLFKKEFEDNFDSFIKINKN
jgi:hypothetical protein